jgi:uncharacterized membrane protein
MEEAVQQLANGLTKAGEALGQAATHLWPEMVKATFFLSLGQLILSVLVLAAAPFAVKMLYWLGRKAQRDSDEACGVAAFFGAILLTIVVIAALLTLPYAMMGAFAPEGTTILQYIPKVK